MSMGSLVWAVAPKWWHKLFLVIVAIAAASLAFKTVALVAAAQEQMPAEQGQATGMSAEGLKYLAAGLAVGLAGIGGGYAVGVAGAAAASAVAENREIAGTVLLYVALGEGIAIYGLLIAILLIFVA